MKRIIFVFALSILCFADCKKTSTPATCGCDSPTIDTAYNWKGYLFFNSTQKQYEVQIGVPGVFNDYFICDSTSSQLQSIIDTNRRMEYPVIFSGEIHSFCVPDSILGYINSEYTIKLTDLIKQ